MLNSSFVWMLLWRLATRLEEEAGCIIITSSSSMIKLIIKVQKGNKICGFVGLLRLKQCGELDLKIKAFSLVPHDITVIMDAVLRNSGNTRPKS